MPRLIELQHTPELPARLTVSVGDVLRFGASGGRIRSGGDILQMLGPFNPAVLATNGEILSPQGAPNTLLFVALGNGEATIEVVEGDPWHAPRRTIVKVAVRAPGK